MQQPPVELREWKGNPSHFLLQAAEVEGFCGAAAPAVVYEDAGDISSIDAAMGSTLNKKRTRDDQDATSRVTGFLEAYGGDSIDSAMSHSSCGDNDSYKTACTLESSSKVQQNFGKMSCSAGVPVELFRARVTSSSEDYCGLQQNVDQPKKVILRFNISEKLYSSR